jgi:hypothetical protein
MTTTGKTTSGSHAASLVFWATRDSVTDAIGQLQEATTIQGTNRKGRRGLTVNWPFRLS